MSRIRASETNPERLVRKFLFSTGLRYRKNDRNLPGKPDIVLKKFRTAIFIHGCFWHGHEGCKYYKVPKTRTKWWVEKITRNKLNDERVQNELRINGWNVLIVWECELRQKLLEKTLKQIESYIKDGNSSY